MLPLMSIDSNITDSHHRYRAILIQLLQAVAAVLVLAAAIHWPWVCEPLQTALKTAVFIHAACSQRRTRTADRQ